MVQSPIPSGRRGHATLHASSEVTAAMTLVPGIEQLVVVLREKDPIVLRHSERAASYAYLIGYSLGLRRAQLLILQKGGILHDMGKLAVPLGVLQKPGALTAEEWEIIRRHPASGHERLIGLIEDAALDVVLYHHERYDGRGYPQGLKGQAIPVLARVFSIADSLDAMTSRRHPYRAPLSLAAAREEILRCSDTQFDPVPVEAFVEAFDLIVEAFGEWQAYDSAPAVIAGQPEPIALDAPAGG